MYVCMNVCTYQSICVCLEKALDSPHLSTTSLHR